MYGGACGYAGYRCSPDARAPSGTAEAYSKAAIDPEQPPGAHEVLVVHRADLVDVVLVACQPVRQRLGVVQAQVLDIQHGQRPGLGETGQLRDTRRIRTREDAFLDPGVDTGRTVAPDRVNQREPILAEMVANQASDRGVIVGPDVLQHADRDEGVVLAGDVAVIVEHVLDAVVQPLAGRLRAGVLDLLPGDVECAHADAVFPGHVTRQTTPATAEFHDPLAGLKRELATDVFELRQLRLFERQVGLFVVGAGVLHRRLIEPQPVELVAEVVMVLNVPPGRSFTGRFGGRAATRQPARRGRHPLLLALHLGGDLGQEFGEVTVDVDAPRAVQVAEGQIGIAQHAVEGFAVADAQREPRRATGHRADLFAIPEFDRHRRAAGEIQQLLGDPAFGRARTTHGAAMPRRQGQGIRPLLRLRGRLLLDRRVVIHRIAPGWHSWQPPHRVESGSGGENHAPPDSKYRAIRCRVQGGSFRCGFRSRRTRPINRLVISRCAGPAPGRARPRKRP